MGTVRELRSKGEVSERPIIRLVVLENGDDAKVLHFHRARGERRPIRILHPSMLSEGNFPWDPDHPRPHRPTRGDSHDER